MSPRQLIYVFQVFLAFLQEIDKNNSYFVPESDYLRKKLRIKQKGFSFLKIMWNGSYPEEKCLETQIELIELLLCFVTFSSEITKNYHYWEKYGISEINSDLMETTCFFPSNIWNWTNSTETILTLKMATFSLSKLFGCFVALLLVLTKNTISVQSVNTSELESPGKGFFLKIMWKGHILSKKFLFFKMHHIVLFIAIPCRKLTKTTVKGGNCYFRNKLWFDGNYIFCRTSETGRIITTLICWKNISFSGVLCIFSRNCPKKLFSP